VTGELSPPISTSLLTRILRDYPFQPATAVWRAVEVQVILDHGLPEGRGLDLGCGDGLLTRILLETAGPRSVVGVEPDPLEAELAQSLGIYEALHVTGGGSVPEPAASFDWVLSNSVLEHVDDLEAVLAEVARLLRPGGVFLFTVPSAGFAPLLRGPLLPRRSRSRYMAALDRRLYHLRYWPDQGWPPLPTGLRVEQVRSYLSRGQVRRWESISRITAGALSVATRGRRRPIEIQRSLGLRRGRTMPAFLARGLARVLGAGASRGTGGGCVLVVARRIQG
jgi:SAM-dependent methyltransferase